MKEIVTLEVINDLPNKLELINKEARMFNNLLSKEMINKYYYTNIKKDMVKVFNKFNDYKVFYNDNNTISEEVHFWVSSFIKTLTNIVYKLNCDEFIYLVNTFFLFGTEDYVCFKLHISRSKLQIIKKSTLVKMFIEFNFNG